MSIACERPVDLDTAEREAFYLTHIRAAETELLHAQIDLAEERCCLDFDARRLAANWQQLRDAQAAFSDYLGRVFGGVVAVALAAGFWAATHEPVAACAGLGIGCVIAILPEWRRREQAQGGDVHDAVDFAAGDFGLVSAAVGGRGVRAVGRQTLAGRG